MTLQCPHKLNRVWKADNAAEFRHQKGAELRGLITLRSENSKRDSVSQYLMSYAPHETGLGRMLIILRPLFPLSCEQPNLGQGRELVA